MTILYDIAIAYRNKETAITTKESYDCARIHNITYKILRYDRHSLSNNNMYEIGILIYNKSNSLSYRSATGWVEFDIIAYIY